MTIVLKAGAAALGDWRAIWRGAPMALDPAHEAAVAASAAAVTRILDRGEPVYGINTGFGKLAGVRIAAADLAELQRNIVLSHAAGVGEPSPVETVRLMMALKLGSLAQGASGVRPETLRLLEAMLARGLTPIVPAQGSVGASGDLGAPRPYGRGDDRRRRGAPRGARHAGRGWARRSWPRADRARAEGGTGAAQRHAILHRQCARRPVPGGDFVALGAGRRGAVDRRGARLRCAVRRAHPCFAPPSRSVAGIHRSAVNAARRGDRGGVWRGRVAHQQVHDADENRQSNHCDARGALGSQFSTDRSLGS